MATRWVVLALLLPPLLAGCLSPSSDVGGMDTEPGAPTPAPLEPLMLSDCREQIGIFPVTAAQAAPYVPDGFGLMPPLPPDVYADADPTGASATLLFVAFFCEEPQVSFLVPWFPAVPPQDERVANATYHAVAGAPVVKGALLEQWFALAGIPFLAGDVVQEPILVGTAATMSSSMSAQALGFSVTVEGTSPRLAAATPQEMLPLFVVEDREVVGRLDLHISEHTHWQFGAGTAEVSGFLQPPGPGLSTHSAPGMPVTLVA